MNTIPKTFIGIFGQQLVNGKTINNIEIPIIQRDYAQGRETKEVSRIRDKFVDVLFKALTGKPENCVKLDFVYGNIDEGKLIPLDGQQRLTTLFLLHWYIAKHENINPKEQLFLKNFTYKTRFSSKHFCDSLVECTPNFNGGNLSEWIIDQNWFMFSWEKDPTIHSMLVMLDKIHTTFKNEVALWSRLNDAENPPISFYFLALEDMGLTDSLYIKMNSRGKPLTEFEHFKAEFEKIIKAVSTDLYDEFVKKVDIDWVDMLWRYRGSDDIIDDEFMKYYRFVTEMLCYEQEIEIVENDFDLAEKVFSIQNESAINNLKFLFKCFDSWKNLESIDSFFDSIFSKFQYESNKVQIYSDNTNLFGLCCNEYGLSVGRTRKFSLNNTLLLYATLQYVINQALITKEEFTERIRIIRNLVLNSPDEIRETRMQALLNDVKNVMVEGIINLSTLGFNEVQKKEEIEKVSWRQNNTELIEVLNHLEDHFLLQGSVVILGLEEPEKFKKRADNFRMLFNKEINYLTISKALLVIGDYSQLALWRFLFGNENDSTWRELFTVSKQRKYFEKTQTVLLELLDTIVFPYNEYLIKKIDSYLVDTATAIDWRYYFIKYPGMRKGNSGVYWWKNDSTREKQNQYEIIMMNTSFQLNGKHWDPFLYVVYTDWLQKGQLTLKDYGSELFINETNESVKCQNSSWDLFDSNNSKIYSIEILQENGNDIEDRIEALQMYLETVVSDNN